VLLTVLVILLLDDDGDDSAATTGASSTTAITTTSTTASPTTSPGPKTTATTTSVAATTTTSTATTTLPPFAGDTAPKTADGNPFAGFGLLTDVRIAQRAEGFTRVVFDFERSDIVPWWRVEYAEGPFVGAGGPAVDVDGDAFLRVTLSSSTVDLSGAEIETVYGGPNPIEQETNAVVEMAIVEDFEGVLVWVIGLKDGEHPFLVGSLTDHPRIYVDIGDEAR
jgi:hypothetical protein